MISLAHSCWSIYFRSVLGTEVEFFPAMMRRSRRWQQGQIHISSGLWSIARGQGHWSKARALIRGKGIDQGQGHCLGAVALIKGSDIDQGQGHWSGARALIMGRGRGINIPKLRLLGGAGIHWQMMQKAKEWFNVSLSRDGQFVTVSNGQTDGLENTNVFY